MEEVRKILELMGIILVDEELLSLSWQLVTSEIKNILNREDIPAQLDYCIIYRVLGRYLDVSNVKNQSVYINTQVLTSLTRGDVRMDFKVGATKEEIFSNIINKLNNYGYKQMLKYRRLRC